MKYNKVDFIYNGTITSVKGFKAGATNAGVKKKGPKLDLGILFSETPCKSAGVFTTNKIKAAPVIVSQNRVPGNDIQIIIANSGCANAVTGEQGMQDAITMASLAAEKVGINPDKALVASTGVIGKMLPMDAIKKGIENITLSDDGGHDFAKAIMTTDTVSKEAAVSVNGGEFIIGGVAKGSGMIHPQMGTMLCFITTDANIDVDFLTTSLHTATDISFNMISVDGDTSTNDTIIIMANGLAKNKIITQDSDYTVSFQQALNEVCIYLAKAIAADGEGATKLIEVNVKGAMDTESARLAARTIANSPLVKTAVYGCDPNWGRIIAAAGRSGSEVVESKTDLSICNISLLEKGVAVKNKEKDAARALANKIVVIDLDLNLGKATATAWGCDLTREYVTINSDYTT
ncbi:MAG: bifunctional glutamate N-acetyltransferase/amino-acid acetyltransferase ArgJ [Dehalococcoidales bacterium]|nr:bifunctional glutamate N-acetyltransferase/amino-acid acetyltransferase ArgJ [Dehalococcoidales bacterium]